MIKPVNGKDVFVWVTRGSSYALVGCGKTSTLSMEQDEIPTATSGSGTDETFLPGYARYTFSVSSLTTIDILGKYQFYEFIDNRRAIHEMKVVFTNGWGDILQYEFDAMVINSTATNDVKSYSSADVNMRITGGLTKTIVYAANALLDSAGDPVWDSNGEIIRTS